MRPVPSRRSSPRRLFAATGRLPVTWRSALVVAALWPAAGCRCEEPPPTRDDTPPAASAARPATNATGATAGASLPEVTTLLAWKESAFLATLRVEEGAVLVLTPTTLIRLQDGAPPETKELPIGAHPALTRDAIVYWHDGAVRSASPRDGSTRRVIELPRAPQRFVASESRWAWVEVGPEQTFTIKTLEGDTPRTVYQTQEHLGATAMREDQVYFVERARDGSWRVGAVALTKGRNGGAAPASYTSPRRGRTPSMLAPAPDGIYYYDGPARSVRRLSPDLEQETLFAEGVICSPLAAVTERVVCGHVEGVFEIPGKGRPPRVLAREAAAIAAIAADRERVVWVADTGADQLAVRAVRLQEGAL